MYRKLSQQEYFEVKRTWGMTDARFWHAVGADNKPCSRRVNNYRAAAVLRSGNRLYFLCRGVYELPESEYRFVDGDVNVNLTLASGPLRTEYNQAKNMAIKLGCKASELIDMPMFDSAMKVGPVWDVPKGIPANPDHPHDGCMVKNAAIAKQIRPEATSATKPDSTAAASARRPPTKRKKRPSVTKTGPEYRYPTSDDARLPLHVVKRRRNAAIKAQMRESAVVA